MNDFFFKKFEQHPASHPPSFPCGAKARNQVQCGNFEQPTLSNQSGIVARQEDTLLIAKKYRMQNAET